MRITKSLKDIYTIKYAAFNIAVAVAYYYVITYILSIQQHGIPITSVPVYLIYLLSIISSVTMTIALYSVSNTRKNSAKISATSVSAATTVFGGIVSGCGCQTAILFNVLAIGLGGGEATLINTIVSENAPIVFGALIAINLSVIVYYLQKLSKPACRIKK
jgi:hypothetical protein